MLEGPRAYKICSLVAILALLSSAQTASAQVRYAVVDMGVVHPQGSLVTSLNDTNDLVGANIGAVRGKRAFTFLTTIGRAETIEGFPGTDSSVAHAINNNRQVVGSSNTASSVRAFVSTGTGAVQDLGTLPGDNASQAFAINNQDEIVGYSSGPAGIQAVLWRRNGSIEGLGRLRAGDFSRAFALNISGDVVGASGSAGADRAFLWERNRGMQDLGTLPGDTESVARGINSSGRVVGHSTGPGGIRAFLWERNGGMQDLGRLPGGTFSRAVAVNDPGDVVGTSDGPPSGSSESHTRSRATLWSRGGGIEDLNTLIPAGGGFVLTHAVAINNRGTILAIGLDDMDAAHQLLPLRVFLLEP